MKKNILLALVLLMMSKAYSQIVYAPITPNVDINLSPTGGSAANLFPIDFNNDGVVDFNFRWDVFSPGVYFMHITSGNAGAYNSQNQAIGTGSNNSFGVPYAMPLNANTNISSSSTGWITEQRGPLIGDGQSANFLGLGDRYIGVRFRISGQYHYGWVLVSFITNKLIIKSYAYQSSPDMAILAGDTGGSLGVGDYNLGESIKLYPNHTSDYIKIEGIKGGITYKIYNIEGRVVETGATDSNNEINVLQLIAGSYTLSIEGKKQNYIIKFIKK